MKEIAVIGFGDQSRVVWEMLAARGEAGLISCFVDMEPKEGGAGRKWMGAPVLSGLGELDNFRQQREMSFVIALGKIARRRDLFFALKGAGRAFETVIHPSAWVSPAARLGEGTMVSAGVIVGVDAVVGRNVILNTKCSVDHDCVIADHVNISPGATIAGRVRIGEGAFIGAGATIIDEVIIGCHAVVAAGAVVISHVPDGQTVMGVPARSKRVE